MYNILKYQSTAMEYSPNKLLRTADDKNAINQSVESSSGELRTVQSCCWLPVVRCRLEPYIFFVFVLHFSRNVRTDMNEYIYNMSSLLILSLVFAMMSLSCILRILHNKSVLSFNFMHIINAMPESHARICTIEWFLFDCKMFATKAIVPGGCLVHGSNTVIMIP